LAFYGTSTHVKRLSCDHVFLAFLHGAYKVKYVALAAQHRRSSIREKRLPSDNGEKLVLTAKG
jgi:hypothetical protein